MNTLVPCECTCECQCKHTVVISGVRYRTLTRRELTITPSEYFGASIAASYRAKLAEKEKLPNMSKAGTPPATPTDQEHP